MLSTALRKKPEAENTATAARSHAPAHAFEDEWLLKALQHFPLVTAIVADLRDKRVPFLAQALVERQIVGEDTLAQAVETAYRIRYVNRLNDQISKDVFALFNERLCRRYMFVPLRSHNDTIEIATANPLNKGMLNEIEMATGRKPVAYYGIPERIECLIWQFYNPAGMVQELLARFDKHEKIRVVGDNLPASFKAAPENRAPVVQLLDAIIEKAVRMQASDIHIEHDETSSLVRYRVDGTMRHIRLLPQILAKGPLVSRIKIMAELDITMHHRPQDGRAKIRVGSCEVGLRVSILPTKFGEKAVIRILDSKAAEVPFERLGFNPKLAARLENLLKMQQGIILVTGPTGSGKTTTLYSMLNKIKSGHTNIVTIEDPVEYRLEGINQVQVNEKQGLSFPGVLRSVLRQDPDVIMVGEIRDRETADVSFQAALTGHLVFTTVHTNDTISTLSRLVDMGVERFKIGPGLLVVTAQRLARRLCDRCKKPVTAQEADASIIAFMRSHGLPPIYNKPVGCEDCDWTGYKGRLALLEFLEMNQALRDLIGSGADEASIRESALKSGCLMPLTSDALWHLANGDTSVAEAACYIDVDKQTFESNGLNRMADESSDHPVQIVRSSSGQDAIRKILVAGKDAGERGALRLALEAEGFSVSEVEDGDQAVACLETDRLHLVVADLGMQKRNAFSVARHLRGDARFGSMPMLITSNFPEEDLEIEAMQSGADDYVRRPASLRLIVARVKSLLRRSNYRPTF